MDPAPGPFLQLLPHQPPPPLRLRPLPPALAPLNPSLNAEQMRAVSDVLAGHADGASYTLHGPPGTGKTLTCVEIALQLLRAGRSPVLCVAPSPSAADNFCARLAAADPSLGPAQMVRVNDPRRHISTVMAAVAPFCFTQSCEGVPLLSLPLANPQQRLFVATCASAALLRSSSSARHFDAVVIDEAGQATAAETLVCLAGLTGPHTAVVLVGDPRQLGPITHSRPALAAGLGRSLLEMFLDQAEERGSGEKGARRRITQLTRNYRSHADVLSLPSRLFYGNSLQCCADAATIALPAEWERDHSSHCRVAFHGVRGQQRRDGDAPSWCNPVEAAAVVAVVEGLLNQSGLTIPDFGVVATFRRQVQLIRSLLRQRGLGGIRVGTIEDYQGQQERVVVISTVLTRPGTGAQHADDALGFLANPRRFNVALTRAKALNIVVGHPVPLSQWGHWRALMQGAIARGAYTGAGADGGGGEGGGSGEGVEEIRAAVSRMAELSLLGSGCGAEAEDDQFTSEYGEEMGFRVAL